MPQHISQCQVKVELLPINKGKLKLIHGIYITRAAKLHLRFRHNLLYSTAPSLRAPFSDFTEKTRQSEEILDSEQCPFTRKEDERVRRCNIRPVQRNGRLAPIGIEKEDATLAWQSPYFHCFELDIPIWVEWVGNSEGLMSQILLGCSEKTLWWIGWHV